MGQFLLLLVVALTVAAVVFGVTVLVTGGDPGMAPAEPDGRAVPLPGTRPLAENDVASVRFDRAVRGYRMAQVDQALRRAAYDIGYKDELIGVLEAEVAALREGRAEDAEAFRRAREAALVPAGGVAAGGDATGGAATDGSGPAVSEVTVSAADAPQAAEPASTTATTATTATNATTEDVAAASDGDRADRDRPAGSSAPGAATGSERG